MNPWKDLSSLGSAFKVILIETELINPRVILCLHESALTRREM